MRTSTRAVALSLVLIAVLPLALAQGNASLSVALSPTSVTFARGDNATTSVTVSTSGLQPVTVHLSFQNATGNVSVSFDKPDLNVAPGVPGAATASVTGPSAGTWQVTIVASEVNAVGSNSTSPGFAVLKVTIQTPTSNSTGNSTSANNTPLTNSTSPPRSNSTSPSNQTTTTNSTNSSTNTTPASNSTNDSAGGAPPVMLPVPFYADPQEQSIAVDRGASAPFRVTLTDPRTTPTNVTLTLHLPLGWGGALDARTLTIPANSSRDAGGSVRPGATARNANATLDITNGSTTVTVRLDLTVLDPVPYQLGSTGPPANQSAPPQNDSTATSPPPPQSPPPPTIHVEPSDVGGSPGVTVLVTLVVSNPGPAPISGSAAVSLPPFLAQSDDASFLVPSGGEGVVTFSVKIDESAAIGTNYSGLASTSLEAIAPARFTVHVTGADAPLVAPAAVKANGDARILLAAGALAIGAGTLVLVALARRWPGLGLFALYARLAPRRALEHPRRAQMLDLLRQEPGLTLADLQRRMGLSNGVARHHLALLEAAGAVRNVPDGTKRRLWPMEAPRVEATPGLRERALATIRARGSLRASELAAELGVSRQSLHYHLKRLEAEGKIRATRGEGELILQPVADHQPEMDAA